MALVLGYGTKYGSMLTVIMCSGR